MACGSSWQAPPPPRSSRRAPSGRGWRGRPAVTSLSPEAGCRQLAAAPTRCSLGLRQSTLEARGGAPLRTRRACGKYPYHRRQGQRWPSRSATPGGLGSRRRPAAWLRARRRQGRLAPWAMLLAIAMGLRPLRAARALGAAVAGREPAAPAASALGRPPGWGQLGRGRGRGIPRRARAVRSHGRCRCCRCDRSACPMPSSWAPPPAGW